MSTSDPRRRLKRIAIPLGIWVLSIAPAELAFRFLGRQPADTVKGHYAAYGDKGGYKNASASETHVNWWSGPFVVRTDAHGLRIPDTDTPEQHAVKRDERLWIALGDSQGFGNGLPYEKSLTGRLAAMAKKDGITFRNLSVGGHVLRSQLDLLEWYTKTIPAKPERLVLFLTPHMIAEADVYHEVVVKDGELFRTEPSTATQVRRYLSAFSAVYLTVRDALRAMGSGPGDSGGKRMYFYEPETMNDELYARFEKAIASFETWAEQHDVALSLVYLPFVVEVQVENGLIPGSDALDTKKPWEFVARASAALDIPATSIRPAMDVLAAKKKALSLRGDSHYNPELSTASAELLYEELVAPHRRRPDPQETSL